MICTEQAFHRLAGRTRGGKWARSITIDIFEKVQRASVRQRQANRIDRPNQGFYRKILGSVAKAPLPLAAALGGSST